MTTKSQSKSSGYKILGASAAVKEIRRSIEQLSDSTAAVLIHGESGTGKDLTARAIHHTSPRANKPFVKVNCCALPETVIEAELFGCEKQSPTGKSKIGKIEKANGGTLFLEDIAELPLDLQIKLLRVIQFKEFERLGSFETKKTTARVITATSKNLKELLKQGLFRVELYDHINVSCIYLPPLRNRKADIMLLANHFLENFSTENNKAITRISTPAIELLTSYHWPGNVTELESCIESAVRLCDGDVIRAEHLPPSLQMAGETEKPIGTLIEIIANTEKELIIDALKRSGGQQRKAAKQLGITERILGYKIKKYGIRPKMLS